MRSSRWKPTSDSRATASASSSSASAVRGSPRYSATSASRCSARASPTAPPLARLSRMASPQVRLGLVQPAREQLRLAAQRHRVGAPAGRPEPLGLGGEGVGERDDVGVGARAVEQTLVDAQVPVEDADGELGQGRGLEQVGEDARAQVAPGVRGRGLGPRGDDQRGCVAGLQRQPTALGGLGGARSRDRRTPAPPRRPRRVRVRAVPRRSRAPGPATCAARRAGRPA